MEGLLSTGPTPSSFLRLSFIIYEAPYYPDKSVKKRAVQLPREYPVKARTMDSVYGGCPEGEEGPVAKRPAYFPFQ